MSKYKVGDKVKIKTWEQMEQEFGLNRYGAIDCKYSFTNSMKEYCGQVLEIKCVYNDKYAMVDNYWNWSDAVIEGLANEDCTLSSNHKEQMMKTHKLKILDNFADAIVAGDKTFEIRENDRGFQKGDAIKFQAISKECNPIKHSINDKIYCITYVLNGWGLKNNRVVFSIKEKE